MMCIVQYGQPDAQQWAHYGAQTQQHYGKQQPDYSWYYQQQQAQHAPAHPQPQAYPPQATLIPKKICFIF